MSKQQEIMNKINKKRDPRDLLLGSSNTAAAEVSAARSETAASKETSNEGSDIDTSAVANQFFNDDEVEVAKKLKGIYIDEDVLAIYEEQAKKKTRGWGSRLVSSLLRDVFEKEGLLEKRRK